MTDILTTFGFAWMIVSAALGLVLGAGNEKHGGDLEALARGGRLHEYHQLQSAYRHRVTVHAHGFLFSLVCVCVSLAMPKMSYGPTASSILAWGLISATVIWTGAGFARIRALMGLADFVLLISLIATAVGLARSLA